MTRRNRTLRLIAMLVVLAGTLVSLVAPVMLVQAQEDANQEARPPEFPIEVLLDEQYFLFDREIPIALDGLFEVGQQDDLTFYAETAEGPHDRLFVSSAVNAESVARYLPETPVGDFPFPAAGPNHPPLVLLMDPGSDLVRFVLLDEGGRPPVLGETLQFQ